MEKQNKIKSVSYAKWGYIFILPFFLSYAVFSLIPLADTIRNSFYEYYAFGLKTVGPNWTGLSNYVSLLSSDLPKYAWNTFVMWVLGFVPQIKPLLTYTLITSLIGGLQMFDVPQILTAGKGAPDRTTMTLIMYLNKHLQAKNYGIAGALSVFLFIISAILCWMVFKMNTDSDPDGSKSAARRARKGGKA